VDKKDKIIGYKDRSKILHKDIYRVSAVWITNARGEILLAQRAFNKKHDPGKWGPAVSGTVEKGETYKENAMKEYLEELGIKPNNLEKGIKRFSNGIHRHYTQWFISKIDKKINDIHYAKNEVVGIKWYTKKEILKIYNKNKSYFIPSMEALIDIFL